MKPTTTIFRPDNFGHLTKSITLPSNSGSVTRYNLRNRGKVIQAGGQAISDKPPSRRDLHRQQVKERRNK